MKGTNVRLGVLALFLISMLIAAPFWWELTSVARPNQAHLEQLLAQMDSQLEARVVRSLEGDGLEGVRVRLVVMDGGNDEAKKSEKSQSQSWRHALETHGNMCGDSPVRLTAFAGSVGASAMSSASLRVALASAGSDWDKREDILEQAAATTGSSSPSSTNQSPDFTVLWASRATLQAGLPAAKASASSSIVFGSRRLGWAFSDEAALDDVARALCSRLLLSERTAQATSASAARSSQARAIAFPPAPAMKVFVGLLFMEPVAASSETHQLVSRFGDLVQDVLEPVVKALSPVANIVIESQVLPPHRLGQEPARHLNQQNEPLFRYIPSQSLMTFFNHHDLNLDSAETSTEPVVHLLLAVPPSDPLEALRICEPAPKGAVGAGPCWPQAAYLLPQWGGVVFTGGSAVADLEFGMRLAIGQLRELVGLASFDSQASVPAAHGVSQWEVDSLVRHNVFAHLATASASLQSLATVIRNLTEIPVPETTVAIIESALHSLERADAEMGARHDYAAANVHARDAVTAAERAFFHKDMLAMLYFPDEHKYAVYALPFFPVFFQFVGAIWNEISVRREKRKRASDQAA